MPPLTDSYPHSVPMFSRKVNDCGASTSGSFSSGRPTRKLALCIARNRWLGSVLAHVCGLAMLVIAAVLQQISVLQVVSLATASLAVHGVVWAVIEHRPALARHDPAMNVPLAALAMAMLLSLGIICVGTDRLEVLAAAAPFMVLAAFHLKRLQAAWFAASLLGLMGLGLMAARRTDADTHAIACELLSVTGVIALAMCLRPARFVKRVRWSTVDIWVRSSDRQQQTFMWRYLIGAFNCLAAVIVLNWGLRFGVCKDPLVVQWLTWLSVIVVTTFYVVLRSGLNRRFADPSLTEPEILSAIAFLAVGYWLAGSRGEGIAMIMLVVILMFGMFSTTPRRLGRCSLFGLLTFGIAMVAVTWTDTDARAVQQQMQFVTLVIVLPTIYLLADQLAKLRARLRERKDALATALARIEALATRDELTGLPNRRDMLAQLAAQQQRAIRSGSDFCVCMIDIDHFKKVNDVHGHGVGDDVLKAFARVASASLRETDVLGRWGGEEFLLMLPDAEGEVACLAVERMRQIVSATAMSMNAPQLVVTFSAGLVRCLAQEPFEKAIERADHALYAAKSGGRNQTVMA